MDTLKPQDGQWTLVAPDGRTWKAESPLKCCHKEQRERVPVDVAVARIVSFLNEDDWVVFADVKPEQGQMCIVAAGPDSVAQIIPVRWCHYDEEFYWHDQAQDLGLDPIPTEAVTHWMPWPDDPTT